MHLVPVARPPLTPQPWGSTWRAPLPPYQQAGIARLLAAQGVLLADEMGLGGTGQGSARAVRGILELFPIEVDRRKSLAFSFNEQLYPTKRAAWSDVALVS